MKPHELKRLIDGKRRWSDPIPSEDAAKGFKGWYSSKYLPHFDFPHKRQYLTYRLADSLPSSRRDEWQALMALDDDLERQREIERHLDLGHGACHLREPRIAELVQENLWHHDGEHYRLLAWVVMPNHVHVLVEVRDMPLHKILHAWKGYTANAANKILGRRGIFWENDYFDRFIRNEDHLRRVVRYIESNPVKAHLAACAADWPWSSARFRDAAGAWPVVPT